MGRNTLEFEIYERLRERYDIEELIEVLDISVEDILDAFEDKIIEKIRELEIDERF